MVGAGWQRFPYDPALADWAASVLPHARELLAGQNWSAGGTWCVGVHALDNDAAGRVGRGPPLPGCLLRAIGATPLDRAQLSAVRPGYPRRDPEESAAGFRFRLVRDAAHLDGLLPVGPDRRRMLREPHAFLLGIPLTQADAGASPLAVWEDSPALMAHALAPLLAPHPPEDWPGIDLTEAYHSARRQVFEACPRRLLHVRPGEAVLVHRLALHGISPWQEGAGADPAGRVIAYFRPPLADPSAWPDLSRLALPMPASAAARPGRPGGGPGGACGPQAAP